MTDAIDLLEVIGKDPSLRYAARDQLATILAEAQASEGLISAVANGDSSLLAAEFGGRTAHVNQDTQHPGHGDHDDDHDHKHDDDHDHDHDHDHHNGDDKDGNAN